MKNLITTIASLMLLMIFVLQFSTNQLIQHRMMEVDMAVETFRDNGKEEGYFSPDNVEWLQQRISDICDCEINEVQVAGTTDAPNEQGVLIYYSISYPMKDLVAANDFLGIQDDEDQVIMVEEGWAVSRYEEPDNNNRNHDFNDDGTFV